MNILNKINEQYKCVKLYYTGIHNQQNFQKNNNINLNHYQQHIHNQQLAPQSLKIYQYFMIIFYQHHLKDIKNQQGKNNNNLIGIIVYCLELNAKKQQKLKNLYNNLIGVKITNSFTTVVQNIISILGYEQSQTEQLQKTLIHDYTEIQDSQQNRFVVDKNNNKNPAQQFSNPQQYLIKGHRILLKMFQLPYQIESMQLKKIKQILIKQLKQFLKIKKQPIVQNQFKKFQEANTLQQLCRICVYFYTLQKPALYYNLNWILKNLRYIKFQQQFTSIRLYGFLLLLNYFFIYNQDYQQNPQIFYRYTAYKPQRWTNGNIISISSFYSVSSNDKLIMESTKKSQKKTKIIIHPISQKDNLSLKSLFPAYLYSAYPKQQQYLYAPFTRFKILSVSQTIVHLQQLPRNIFLKKIIDLNLYPQNNKVDKFDWQLNYQLKYQKIFLKNINNTNYNQNIQQRNLRKIYYNLGILYFSDGKNYQLAKEYFQIGLNYAKQSKNNYQIAIGYNNIGLVLYKIGKYQDAKSNIELSKSFNQNNILFMANIFNNLASISQSQNNYQQALSTYQKAYNLLEQQSLKKSCNSNILQATLLNNIGYCKMNSGKQKQAIQLFQKVKKKYKQIYDDYDCQEIVAADQNIAKSYQQLQMYIKALQHLLKAKDTQLKIVGELGGKNLLNIYLSIGKMYNKLQKYDECVDIYNKSLEISKRLHGQYHRTTAIIYCNLASAQESLGLFQGALQNFENSLNILTTPYRVQNQDIFQFVIENRQLLIYNMGKNQQLEGKLKKIKEIEQQKTKKWEQYLKQKYK